jgi:amino acid adenylation domain-containing protein
LAFTFLVDGEGAEQSLSYGGLDLRARAVAARLQELGLAGERLLLLFPPGLDYVAAFLGCLYAGAVAVPAYPPTGSRGLPRLRSILADCEPRAILTVGALRAALEKQMARRQAGGDAGLGLPLIDVDALGDAGADLWRDPGLSADALAFLQYTSGSTSTPKGVRVTHGNLAANERMIQESFGTHEGSVVVSWLPLYHDMGLIGGLLHPLCLGARCILMSPMHFLQRPLRWLEAVSRYGATVSGGPNFAYELCARRASAEAAAALDLGRWTVAFNGAEPVRAEVLDRFAAAFAPAGFRRSSFFPCYGLAEATLLVSAGRAGEEPAGGGPVPCGAIASGLDVRIVDPATGLESPAGEVGEIWVAGPTVAAGYWKRPEASAETFGARLADGGGTFLRTGDLGLLHGGGLVIAGRIKDLIVIRGRNLYPQDVEWTVERCHPAVRPGCGAAFAVDGLEGAGEERLVVVQEVAQGGDLDGVALAIRQAVAEEHEVQVSGLVLVRAGGVPKTTSGKIQRRACRELFLAGELAPLLEWREGETGRAALAKTAPRTPAEERLARSWEEVLGLAPGTVGVEDNFFALGGDSVRGTQLLVRLQEAGIEIALEELFAARSLGELAELAEKLPHPRPLSHLPPSRPPGEGRQTEEETRVFPLTSPQRRLWFLDQLEPGNPAYNLGIAVRITGRLDAQVLARALSEIVRRHEALRTVFRVVDGAPVQVVQPAVAVSLPVLDGAAAELEREMAGRRFDLTQGPLLRAQLVRLGPEAHELHVAVHHIVSDGWSFGVLLRETARLYAAFAAGRPSPLPELAVQYGDYALWTEQRLASEAVAAQIAAWKQRLSGSLPVLELPADRPRPAVPSWRGAHATHRLPAALTNGLRGLAGGHGASLFMALLAGFQALLGRLTVQDDVLVGTAVANRDRVELEDLIGFFVNTLALRTDLAGDPAFVDLLGRVRRVALAALAGREVPFERLVDEVQTRRDLSVNPIVQVMLVLQNEPLEVPPVAGLALDGRETDNGTARFDLALSLLETGDGLAAVFKYSRDLFDAATIERMAGWLETLLAGAVAAPGRRLSELPLLTEAEHRQAVVEWNATGVPAFTAAGCLHELIEAQVDRTPEAVAVACEGESLTYRELDERANQLARHLQRLGVAPEVLVGVAVERSLELMVGLLGVLKAGGAYVPLDPGYPAERLAFMVEDAQVPVLLTQDRLLGRVPQGRARVVCLDRTDPTDPTDRSDAKALPDHPAYCIFTSGSTGRPKGAVNTHRGIVNRLLWMQAEYGLTPGEGVMQKTPVSFDVSVWELFWPLMVGARVVLARPGGHQDSAYLAELIERERITTLHFVPSMLQVFLEEPQLDRCTSLRRVITSGEALPRELEERFGARLSCELHNLYGPTEAAVDVTYWPCLREPGSRTVPIGRPIANLQIHLLDPGGRPVPVGVAGHLHIGGVGLARGYLRRPELTAERFVPDPFSQSGGRLYATGDLARRRPDGVIEFLGRIDHQVKIRGFRIEMGEIEAALNAHPSVRESVVTVHTEPGGGKRLIAYVVGTETEELRVYLAGRLPEYMVPAVFVALPAFPLNPSGKVDRKALPAPDDHRRPEETAWVAPRTPLEERLAAIWRELLGVERVGVLDDFFALGGDSIQGALFVNRLQRELSSILYVMSLFDAPTVAQYAAYLEGSYRAALVAAGWIERDARGETEDALPVDAATEAAEIEALRHHLAARFSSDRTAPVPEKNRPVVFLLSPFRSGSTLLRVMLAGHPGLFAPPELELLGFESLGERRRVFAGRDSFSREGLLRAVMELRACDAETAASLLEEAEERDEATPDFYRRLQEWTGGRLLVDKTPRYALDLPTLSRAEDWFAAPLYVHLVRHPAATLQSYLEAKMHEVYRFPLSAGRSPRRQAELVWRLSHEHVLEHLAAVPARRQHRLLFEEMVRDPRRAMEDLCAFLGIDFHPAMLSPYEGKRMTDGLHGAGRMMGDPKFHQHSGIDAGVADRWRGAPEAAPFGAATWALAGRLGYERPVEERSDLVRDIGPRPLERGDGVELPLSFGQQRLWFLSRLEPDSAAYNMPAAVRLTGRLDVAALALACAEIERRHEVLRTVFPSVSGRARAVVREPRTDGLLPVIDLSRLEAPTRREESLRLAAEEADLPFDLAAGPLWRVRLARLAAEEHVLLINLHHIVCDGWSVGLLTRELAALYEAFRAGRPSPLPALPVQYADFAAWQRRRLSGPVLEELVRAWKERLAPPLPVLELPVDRPRPAVETHRGSRFLFEVPAGSVARLAELGRQGGATLFMALTAAFNALLLRYTGQEDVLIGTPVAGRNRAEIEGLIGLFVNTLVLRTDLEGDPDFGTLLGRVRQAVLWASRHEELPFEKLVEEVQVERALGHSPLFVVMLALQNAPPAPLALPGLELERLELSTRTAKFELTLDLTERLDGGLIGGLAGALEYNVDLFDDVTISRLSKHFTHMLARIEGTLRLSDLPLLSEMELHEVVTCFNDSQIDIPMDAVVHDLFKATVRRVPDAVAVSAEGRTLRYRELDELSDRLARRLVRLGVGPDVLVGICAERTPALLVALLAVLKAGGAYVPLDPTNPQERLRHILDDSGASLLLTETALLDALPPHAARILLLDDLLDGLEAEAPEGDVPLPRVLPDHLAYVIYTSGSTGRPKGVEVRHRGVVNFLLSIIWRPGLGERDVVLGLTTLSFDIAVTELFLPLVVGARIELVRRETGLDAAKLAAVLESAGVTFVQATPATWTLLVDSGWPGRPGLKALSGGEALPRALANKLLPRVDTLWNYYGPTETTVWSSFHQVDRSDRPVPLGYPLGNTALHLLGRRFELVPAGAVGELAIGGEGLARGYRGRPDLTAERFVPDPLGPPGARLYRTGDLARRLPDGLIEYLGRLDHQVKIRGFRIEIGEIEAVLLQHPAVRQCAVVALGGGTDKRLVAYVVQNGETAWEALRAHLQEKLPSYMVPASVVFLDRFPLLASGKVDRKSLPDPGRDRPLSASYVSPQSENERLIAQIWQEVLGLERVGIHDNFFDLGGHSLLAAEVHGKLRERMGTDLPLVELFRHPTVHALAQTLSRLGRPEAPAEDLAGLQDAARREREAAQRRRKALARQRGMG